MTLTEILWLPIVMVILFVGWHVARYLLLVWWLYFVFRPKFIKLLEEALDEALGGPE